MPGKQGSNNYPRQTGKHGHCSKGGNVFGLRRATHGLNYRYTYITQAVPPPSVGSAAMSCASVHLAGTQHSFQQTTVQEITLLPPQITASE